MQSSGSSRLVGDSDEVEVELRPGATMSMGLAFVFGSPSSVAADDVKLKRASLVQVFLGSGSAQAQSAGNSELELGVAG